MLREIAIFGAGGFGLEVAMLIEQLIGTGRKWRLVGFFDDGKTLGETVMGFPVLGGWRDLNAWPARLGVVFAVGKPLVKKSLVDRLSNGNLWYPTLIHPSVVMGDEKYVSVGDGGIICAGTIITTHVAIGRHVILNLACTIGHETRIGDFSAFMPACNISGEVVIGECSYWGTGAKVINRITVGAGTVIGAGAVVTRDLSDGATAVGVPARVIKQAAYPPDEDPETSSRESH